MNELRYAGRRLLRHPAPAAAAVMTLAGSVGASCATAALLSAVLLSPRHSVADPSTLYILGTRVTSGRSAGQMYDGFAYPALA